MEEVEIVVPWPASINHYWRAFITYIKVGKFRKAIGKNGKSPQATACRKEIVSVIRKRLKYVEPMFTGIVGMTIYFFPPDTRDRDVDNYNKGILDGITASELWTDDSQVKQLTCVWCEKVSMTTHPDLRTKGCCVVRIWTIPDWTAPTFHEITNGQYPGPLF